MQHPAITVPQANGHAPTFQALELPIPAANQRGSLVVALFEGLGTDNYQDD